MDFNEIYLIVFYNFSQVLKCIFINFLGFYNFGLIVLNIEKMKAIKKKDDSDFIVKIVIIGDSGVGKTNILVRFC